MEHAGVSPSCEPLPHMSSANKETKSHSSLRIHDDHFIWLEEWLCARLKRKIKNYIFQSWLNPPSVGMPRPVVLGMLDMEGL